MLDGGDVDAARVASRPGVVRLSTKIVCQRDGRALAPNRHEPPTRGRGAWRRAQRGARDDAKRALRPDEQVDQIHSRRREVARRSLRNIGHSDGGNSDAPYAARRFDLEPAVLRRRRLASRDLEHVSARQDDRHRLYPRSNRPILESRGAGRARRHCSPHSGAKVGWNRRKPSVEWSQRFLNGVKRHAGAGDDASAADLQV